MKFACRLIAVLSVLPVSANAQVTTSTHAFLASPQTPKRSPIGLIRVSRAEREDLLRLDHRVLLNVVVTDASGRPISGLDEKDFTLFDQGKPQMLSSFQAVEGRSAAGRAHIDVLIDAVNNSFGDVARQRRAVDAFLRQNDGKLSYPVSLAILTESGLQKGDSSTDGNALAEELRERFPKLGRFSFNGGPSGGSQRFVLSIQALRRLAAEERETPGRAILVWMGQGWPTLTDPGYEAATFADKRAYFEALVQLTTTLRVAQMTINNVLPGEALGVEERAKRVRRIRGPEEAEAEDLSLSTMVQVTGGKSLHEGRDFVEEIAACAVDAESYYRISYDPETANQPNELRFVSVKVDQPTLVSRTFALYYAQP